MRKSEDSFEFNQSENKEHVATEAVKYCGTGGDVIAHEMFSPRGWAKVGTAGRIRLTSFVLLLVPVSDVFFDIVKGIKV